MRPPSNPVTKKDLDEFAASLDGLKTGEGDAVSHLSADDQLKIGRAKSEDGVRTFVTRTVVGANVALWFVAAVAYLLGVEATPGIVDLNLKVTMPILMLVLGYYFGSSAK